METKEETAAGVLFGEVVVVIVVVCSSALIGGFCICFLAAEASTVWTQHSQLVQLHLRNVKL